MTNENVTLPLLPLTSGVVLPGMVFTMALETDEARAAVEAAGSAGGRLLLVPHIEGRYATVGVIAEVMEEGELPGGLPGRGRPGRPAGHHRHRRARDRRRPVGPGRAGRRARADRRPPSSWPASTGPCSRTSCSAAGRRPDRRAAARGHRAGPAGRPAGYSPDLTLDPEGRGPRDPRRRGPAAPRPRLGPRHPGRPDAARADQDRRRRGHGEDPARVPAAPPARGHPQGARRARAGRRRRATPTTTGPRSSRARPARARAQGGRARGRQARAHERAEPRARAGSAPGSTPSSSCPGASSPRTASTSPRRRASSTRTTTGSTDVKERILEHLAVRKLQAERGLAPVDGRGVGRHPGPGRPARGGQDLARRVGGRRPRAQVRPGRPRRRARRGRDPRPPPHLRRAPSRAAWSGPCARPGP